MSKRKSVITSLEPREIAPFGTTQGRAACLGVSYRVVQALRHKDGHIGPVEQSFSIFPSDILESADPEQMLALRMIAEALPVVHQMVRRHYTYLCLKNSWPLPYGWAVPQDLRKRFAKKLRKVRRARHAQG